MSARTVSLSGRILYLTEDANLLEAQLAGRDLEFDPERPLIGAISTDEITPGWVCYYFDETLGRYCLVGLRGGKVKPDAVKGGGFSVVVSGISKGCGSSREQAPYSEVAAGVRVVIAKSIEKIYRQNAQNIGLLTSTDFSLVPRIVAGEAIPIEEFTRGLDPISASIVEHGGLFAYNKERLAGRVSPPAITTEARPMTLCEKILAQHAIVDARAGRVGVSAVKPGDAFFARADVRFSHEYVTPMADALFRAGFGADARVSEPESVFAFRDHLTFLDLIMPKAHKDMGLDVVARKLATVQDDFAKRAGVKVYGEVHRDGKLVGSEAICHNKVIEELALPGQLVIGTDSHTCMAGALGCFAFGVGSTDMANAWLTRDVRVTVPETARFVLRGTLRPGVCAKDVMLHVLSQPFFKSGEGIGKVLEFAGDGIAGLSMDERATLTNMAVEAGGFTGIIEADELVIEYLVAQRGLDRDRPQPEGSGREQNSRPQPEGSGREQNSRPQPEGSGREQNSLADDVRRRIVKADPGARYCATFDIDLAAIPPMVATPGDPRNGVPLGSLGGPVRIDIAYGGSCTGGKKADMDMYASVLSQAVAKGKRVARGVHLYLQFGSQDIRRYAEEKGYIDVFERAGAELVDPSCGACIKAGPGASDSPDQVTISAQNRNFPGRSGPGKVYLASPLVVAASAIAGRIALPDEI